MSARRSSSFRFRRALHCAAGGAAAWLAAAGFAAESGSISESELKAAFLPKFPLFVQWPAGTFKQPADPLLIGVLGDAEFAAQLEAAIAGKVIGGRPLRVQVCRDADAARRCHIVFLAGDDEKSAAERVRSLAGSNVLTVSDAPNFAGVGGMVNLISVNKRIRLEINLEAIQRAELRMDPQLLQMARAVKAAPKKAESTR